MKRLLTLSLMAFALIAGGLFTAPKAQAAAPTCVKYEPISMRYPGDGKHQFVCGKAQNDPNGGSMIIYNAITGLPSNITTLFVNENVYWYYFYTPSDASAWFKAHYPNNPYTVTGGCGGTFTITGSSPTTIAWVSEYCVDPVNNHVPQNKWVQATALHEAGHAFEYALNPTGFNAYVSESSNFHQLASQDLANFIKNTPICNVWGTTVPSDYEVWPPSGGNPGAVCNTQGQVNKPYAGKNNEDIADVATGYFFVDKIDGGPSPLYAELFAEEWAAKTGRNAPPVFPLMDGGPLAHGFSCTAFAILWFFDTLAPPPSNITWPTGCTKPTGSWTS